MGDGALSPLAGSGRRYQHAGGDQICRRTFRYHVRNDFGQRQGLADDIGGDPAARRVRRSRRRVSGAARFAHARGPAGAAPSIRARNRALAQDPARGPQGVAPGSRKRPGPCDLETGFYRGVGPVQHRSEARAAKGRRCIAQRRQTIWHGLFMGRLRKPDHSVRLRTLSHCHQMGAGRASLAASHRAGECRRSQSRSRARLCGLQCRVARSTHARSSAMSSTYNARSATTYEHFMGRWSRQLSGRFVEFAGVSDGERILDVGCGTGSLTRVVLESADVKSIAGVDLADVYLESARQKIRDPRVDFKTGDATSLPFADNSFDRAFAMLVLHFVPDAKKAVSEMRRVVRSGGVVAATVWDGLGGMPALRLFWDAAATLGLADGNVLRDFYFRPMTRPNEMLAAWSEAGLESVQQTSITIRFEYENFSDYWFPIAAGEVALGKFALSLAPEQRAGLEAAVRNVYLGGEPDGPRSFATTAWACKGIV